MSDGGAAVIVEVGSMLASTKAGRVVLVVLIAYATFLYVLAEVGLATLWALAAIAAGLVTIFLVTRRRRRARRASLVQSVAVFFVVLLAGATAIFLLARRRRTEPLAPPPSPEEIDRLATMAAV